MKKKTLQRYGLATFIALIIAVSIVAFSWFKPHRDVQKAEVFAELNISELIGEYMYNSDAANKKYLSDDGNSKVLIVKGRVSKISANQNKELVIILKDEDAKVGVSASFTQKPSANTNGIKEGDIIRVKGVITSGNSYDPDLDLYEHATLIQCDIVK